MFKAGVFLRTPEDISMDFLGDQNQLFNQKRYFKSKHDDFLTLSCLNLSRQHGGIKEIPHKQTKMFNII